MATFKLILHFSEDDGSGLGKKVETLKYNIL